MHIHRFIGFMLLIAVSVSSCRKDHSTFVDLGSSGNNCNTTVMKLKKMQDPADANNFIETQWNADGSIKMIKMSAEETIPVYAMYELQGGKIRKAIIRHNNDDELFGTANFVYNSAGQVDSIYLQENSMNNIKLLYDGEKLKKITVYHGTEMRKFWDIEVDTKGNIIKASEFQNALPIPTKEATYTFTRDTRKNPFQDLAVYMLPLEDPASLFSYWGSNNFSNENLITYDENLPLDMTFGFKYKYNENCYPISSQQTLFGVVVENKNFYQYTYY